MYLGKDVIGSVWARPVKAELDNPADNIMGYQESPDDGGDLLQYAEDWGGQQINPEIGKGDIEQDPSINLQGDRPPMDSDFYTSANKSASEGDSTTGDTGPITEPAAPFAGPWGELESRPKDQGAGYGDDSMLKTLPQGFGDNVDDAQGQTFGIGEPNLFEGAWDSPLGEGTVVCARNGVGMENKYDALNRAVSTKLSSAGYESSLIEGTYMDLFGSSAKVASAASARGVSVTDDRIKLADLSDLFAFKRVDKDKLIHKSSNDLWKIGMDANGDTFIERLADLDGEIKG